MTPNTLTGQIVKSCSILIIGLTCILSQVSAHAETEAPTFINGYRAGLDIIGGNTVSPSAIQYTITDLYNEQKQGDHTITSFIEVGLKFGIRHYNHFETELYLNLASGGEKSAPRYYNYIYYPMRAYAMLMPFGIREHYYQPIFDKIDLDFALGCGGIYTWGTYIDKNDFETYRQQIWSKTEFTYDYSIGMVWHKSEIFDIRLGYQRVNFTSDFIGKGLNKFYLGFSLVIPKKIFTD